MPYVGNIPAEKYASFEVQHFTTSATTSYTLTHAVANELDIRLVLNNVVQQPGGSYAYTASATTLTLSSATTSSDTMYCVYIGKAVQTVNPGAGSVGTSQLADESVNEAKLKVSNSPTNGYVLSAQSGASGGLTWAADAAGTVTGYTNGVDNRVITSSGTTTLNGEAKLTFDGTTLTANNTTGTSATVENLVITTDTNANPAYSNLVFKSGGNTSGAWIKGVQASGGNDGRLEFHTNNSGTVGEAMRIRYDGNIGIGETNPTSKLYVISTDNEITSFVATNVSSGFNKSCFKIAAGQATTDASYYLLEAHNGGASGKMIVIDNGNVQNTNNSYGAYSDERIKQDITDANSQWNDIKALKIKNFKLKSNTDLTLLGVVAQDLETANMNGLIEEVKPIKENVAHHSDFGTIEAGTEDNGAEEIKDEEGNITGYEDVFTEGQKVKSVKYSVLYMKAIKCLQEAMEKIETLETKVAALENA